MSTAPDKPLYDSAVLSGDCRADGFKTQMGGDKILVNFKGYRWCA